MARTLKFDRRDYEDVVFNVDKKREHKSNRITSKNEMRKVLTNV